MNKRHFHFQDLPVERLRHVFKYLAPHDLVNPFERLKQQFDIMLAQQPLCLPNNRQMSIQLYYYYLKKIVSKHASQIVYFHLSERSASCAIDSFLPEVPLNKLTWLSLKASLSLDVDYHRFYCDQYDEFFDFVIAIQVLNCLPQLHSLYLRLAKLLTELLNNGHLPQLQNTRVTFSIAHDNIENELLLQIPLKQAFASELRHTNRKIYAGVASLVEHLVSKIWESWDRGIVGENISHLLRIAQRSPYFSELYIESDLDYGRVLSLNKQLGSLLSRQLVILHFTTKEANNSLGDPVGIIDKLDVGELKQSAAVFMLHTHPRPKLFQMNQVVHKKHGDR
ncbi:unnamed protein product [Rotaria socialis]